VTLEQIQQALVGGWVSIAPEVRPGAAKPFYLKRDFRYLASVWGARNVDGRGFDSEANRPTNLQIPLVRK